MGENTPRSKPITEMGVGTSKFCTDVGLPRLRSSTKSVLLDKRSGDKLGTHKRQPQDKPNDDPRKRIGHSLQVRGTTRLASRIHQRLPHHR